MIELFVGDMAMRGLPRITNELVVVALHTTHVTCMWMQQVTATRYIIRAYRVYHCHHHEIGRGVLFNSTWLCTRIQSFLKAYHLQDAFIALMPDSTSVTHGFIACSSAHPSAKEFIPYRTRETVHAYHYLYPREDQRFIFYWYRIAHALLFQYACITIRGNFNCIRITPRFCALIAAYSMVHGAAFRPSQLALDMERLGNRISHYFTKDLVKRCVQGVASIGDDQEASLDVIAACGLLHAQKDL